MTPKIYRVALNNQPLNIPAGTPVEMVEMFCKQASQKAGSFSVREEPEIENYVEHGKEKERLLAVHYYYDIHTSDATTESAASLDTLKEGWNNLCEGFSKKDAKDPDVFSVKPVATKEAIQANLAANYDIFSPDFSANMKNKLATEAVPGL